jgi:hypothetical protein
MPESFTEIQFQDHKYNPNQGALFAIAQVGTTRLQQQLLASPFEYNNIN